MILNNVPKDIKNLEILAEATEILKNPPKEYTVKHSKILSEAMNILLQEDIDTLSSYEAVQDAQDDNAEGDSVPVEDQDLMLHDDDGNTYIWHADTKQLEKVSNYEEESPARPLDVPEDENDGMDGMNEEFSEATLVSLLLKSLKK